MTSAATKAAQQRWADQDLLDQIAALAAQRQHHLSPSQAGGSPLTLASALNIRSYLERRPVKDAPSGPQDAPAAAGPMQAADARVNGPGRTRRPGTKITEPGIYYYGHAIYKVIRSQYSGHLQARRMDPATGRFAYAEGMMGVLRAGDKMTPEDSREYERLYGQPRCSDCGLPLENDLSRERRVGPVCWDKNGHSE